MKILVVYGTETGNAELVADDIQEQLAADFDVSCEDMASADPTALSEGDRLILVCSTYGDGELPNSAQPFFSKLKDQSPDLKGVKFAAFGLGDSFYETFNKGSDIIADALLELGASEVGERGVHDASSGEMPTDVALEWLGGVIAELA